MKKSDEILNGLVKEKLMSITFLLESMQLRFGNYCLNVENNSYLVVQSKRIEKSDEDFYGTLLLLIGYPVQKAFVKQDEFLCIRFSEDQNFFISLRPEDYEDSPEGAILFYGNETVIW